MEKVNEWRKLVDTQGNWVGMERTTFLSIEEAIRQGYEPAAEASPHSSPHTV